MPGIVMLFLYMIQCLFRSGIIITNTYIRSFANAEHGSKLVYYNALFDLHWSQTNLVIRLASVCMSETNAVNW